MESVLISVRPKWCGLIASKEKTVEVRKTKPKILTPYKCYIYCTKDFSLGELYTSDEFMADSVQGKVIGEFVCDKVVKFENSMFEPEFQETSVLSCVDYEELALYLGSKDFGYGWHISDLKIYDDPKELSEFRHCGVNYHFNPIITRPPQSWCYVEKGGEG